jgi:methyltransferase (TIGR00027 family)
VDVDRDAASSTAMLIGRASVLLAQDPRTRHLVPAEAARLSALLVADQPGGPALLRRLGKGWYRRIAWVFERATVPGLFVHFALRKRAIEEAVRAALADGVRQVVVLGAGFVTLAARLHTKFPKVQFFELDHPATQAAKRRTLERVGLVGANLAFVPLDLRSTTPEVALRGAPGFLPDATSIVVVEGLLMYIQAEAVERTLLGLRQALGPGSQLALTFMARRPDGRIQFANQTWVATRWLHHRQEPFL